MTVQQFCKFALPLAAAAQNRYGVNCIGAMAQAALETGWGKSAPGNMYFGIKATGGWTGQVQQLRTTEYVNGEKQYVYSTFRAYSTPGESFMDYAKLISSLSRYRAALNYPGYGQADQYVDAVAAAGYATAPNYASQLKTIIAMIKQQVSVSDVEAALKKKLI